eukprot:TRINITY_DN71235_c0_g1_i1.p1 TRINITY_DN71235_c0_g1~~TRINITY_DN71235_c0_g1_i1.p1  ORF type:complete len:340 (-),score=48.39 TRINITY_DN71235_c0_g1_i1:234-1253(-)
MTASGTFWILNFAFLASGITQNLMAFEMGQMGFSKDPSNFIAAVGNPLGQFLFSAVNVRLWANWDRGLLLSGLPIVVCELGCNFFSQTAIIKIGSGMYQVIYSFVVVMNALPGHFCMGKKLNTARWIALFLIVASVAFSAAAQLRLPGTDFGNQMAGIISALLATVFVSVVYVAANVLLEEPWEKPVQKPLVLAQMLGTAEVSIVALYFAWHVVPNWDRLVADNVRDDLTVQECLAFYVAYLLVCGVHQYAFYYSCSLGPTGAVTAGVNKCAQTAILFFLSDWLYCSVKESQCLSTMKIVGAAGVCLGVLLYGYFSPVQVESNRDMDVTLRADSRECER